MMVLLMFVTVAAAVAFFGTLVGFLAAITARLESIGTGPNSSLAMITWGVRAIESETALIPAEVPKLNQQLAVAADVLGAIDQGLVAVAGAAGAQPGYR